jgi:hypothetical protein
MLITYDTGSGEVAIERRGNVVHDADWRASNTLWRGL